MIKKNKSSVEKATDTKTTTSSTSQRIEKNLYRQTTIRIDKDGNEVITSRYIVKKQVKGRPLYKSFPDKKSAKAALSAVRTGELKPSASKKMTLEQAINLWLDTCATRGVAPTTAMRKRSTARTHVCKPPFDKMQIAALTKDDMDTILDSMVKPDGTPLSYSSKKKAFELVNACINYWVGEQVLERNPLVNYRLETDGDRKSKHPLSYSEDEMKKIMAVLCESKPDGSPRYVCAPIARFAYNTGMRIGELIALKWENVYLDKEPPYIAVNSHAVMVSKSEAERDKKKSAPKGAASKGKYVLEVIDGTKTSSGERVIPLNSRALEILESQKEKSHSMCGFVFRNTKGKAMSGTLITRSWHRALTAAGISKEKIHGIHILRHTFATELVSRGGNIKNVADILGHKSARITMDYYLHPRVEDYAPTVALIEDLVKS